MQCINFIHYTILGRFEIDYNENEFVSAFVLLKYSYTLSNSDFKNLDLLNICICVMGKYTEKEQQRLG